MALHSRPWYSDVCPAGFEHRVPFVSGRMDDMEVLPARLVGFTRAHRRLCSDLCLISCVYRSREPAGIGPLKSHFGTHGSGETSEDGGAAGRMGPSRVPTLEHLVRCILCVPGEILDHAWLKARLDHDMVEEPARLDSSGARLPDDDVADDWGAYQAYGQGCEVEWRDSVDEVVEQADFRSTGSVEVASNDAPQSALLYSRASAGNIVRKFVDLPMG